jgi:ABC-type spermidine/putrescine transport system permease subunit II
MGAVPAVGVRSSARRSWPRRLRHINGIDLALRGFAALMFVFLLAPIATVVVYAFNDGELGKQTATFTGFTTRWFSAAWQDQTLRHSLSVSLKVAVPMAFISVSLGTAAGLAVVRHPWRPVRLSLEALMYYLLVVPEIVLGISLLIFYTRSNFSLGYFALIAGHSPFPIAVVALIVRSRVVALDATLEDAAADLGARSWKTLRDVILPQLAPAIITGLIMAFTFSFDDLIISELLVTPTVSTLPVYIYGSAHAGVTPNVYAIATVMLLVTLIGFTLVGLVYRYFGRRSAESVAMVGAGTGQHVGR